MELLSFSTADDNRKNWKNGYWALYDYYFRLFGEDVLSFIIEKSSRSTLRDYLVSIFMLGSCLSLVFPILKYKDNGGN